MPIARIQIAPMPSKRNLMVSFFFKPMLILITRELKIIFEKEGILVLYAFLSWRGMGFESNKRRIDVWMILLVKDGDGT